MTIDDQIAHVGKLQYWCKDTDDQTALDAIKLTLKDYKRLTEEVAEPEPTPAPEEPAMYQSFVKAYDTFCRFKTKAGAKMDGANGKALKTIIKFLSKESKSKDEAGALEAWMYILLNWDKLTPFIQNQVSLLQINKNLPEILMQLRRNNGKTTGEQAASSVREGIRTRRSGADEGHQ